MSLNYKMFIILGILKKYLGYNTKAQFSPTRYHNVFLVMLNEFSVFQYQKIEKSLVSCPC